MKREILRKYAHLIAVTGINVQPGQEVIIYADLDQPEFVKMLVEECYKCKAKLVKVEWSYQPLEKVHVRYKSVKTLNTLESYEEAKLQYQLEVLPCTIRLDSADPAGLAGMNTEKLTKCKERRMKVRAYRNKMENRYQWCVAAVPSKAWAKRVFPDLRVSTAEEKLWEAILTAAKVTDDPVKTWEEHNEQLRRRCALINTLKIRKLHYTASNGTDLTVGVIPGAGFVGSEAKTFSGVVYNPNIPSEECFITPKKGQADGVVYATKPLSYNGQLIENISIRFENGKAVEWNAEKNKDLLTQIITTDNGSAYLGECALVPFESPINQSGLLFYNTLFDENATCHLALGMGYSDSIRGYEDMSYDELTELGVNRSMVHVDFMIGTPDFSVDAVSEDGSVYPLFRNGTWAI